MKTLQQLVPFETPSILQIHGKAILGSTIPNAAEYIPLVKKRLLEQGVESMTLSTLYLSFDRSIILSKAIQVL